VFYNTNLIQSESLVFRVLSVIKSFYFAVYKNNTTNSPNSMNRIIPKSKILLFFLYFYFSGNTAFAQTNGDYRSITDGNWTSISSWEYYNNGWIPATTYPGQNTAVNNGAVLISNKIDLGTANFTTLQMGTVTITGTLNLKGGNSSASVFNLLTNNLVVSPGGSINFDKKVDLKLPAATNLQAGTGGLTGDCSNNQDIYIGNTVASFCAGGGSNNVTFTQIMTNGGINNAGILSGTQSVCGIGTAKTTFTSNVSGGAWSSASPAVATIDPSSGVINALAVGSSIMTYTVSGVSATRVVYVNTGNPSVPGFITGVVNQCPGLTGQIYSINAVNGAASYVWSVPWGWSITGGQGTNSITVTTGSGGQNGNIQVNAVNGCGTGYANGEGNGYKGVTVAAVPSAPGTAGPDSPTCTGFVAKWAYTSYATKYFLDVSTSNMFTSFVSIYNNLDVGNVLNLTLTGLNPGTTYYYRVRAYSNCGTSSDSTTMNYNTSPIPAAVPVATSISGNVQCNYAEPRWNTVSNATGYYLDIATDNGFTNFVGVYNNFYVSGNNASSPASNLPSGTLYYRVRATNSCATTASSNPPVSFQTTAPLGGSVSPAQTICSGSATSALTLSGNTTPGSIITKWQKATNIGFTANVADISETTNVLSIAKIGTLNVSTYFRAEIKVNSTGCVSYSTPVLITVGSSVTAGSTSTVCVNTALTPITHTTTGFTGIGTPIVNLPTGLTASFNNNIVTISGTPTALGTFNYSIPLTGGCSSTNATGTIKVNPNVGDISLNGTSYVSNTTAIYCPSSTAVFTITSGTGIYWNIPGSWTYVSGQGTTRLEVITGPTNSTGTLSVTVADPQICASYLGVTTSSVIDTPTEGTKTNVICPALGSVVLNSLPSSGTWTLQRTGGNPVTTTTTTGSGSQTTVSNLAVGSYTFKVSNSQGCTSSGLTVTITDATPTATWSAGAWVGGIQPASDKKVVFNDHYPITTAFNACSCTINSGKNVTVGVPNSSNDNAILTVIGDLNVAGTLTFENGASLVQVNDNAINTGNIIYKRNTSFVSDFDYVYWGTPVKDQQLNVLSPNSDKYYSYWNGAWVPENGANKMNPRKGYIIRVPRMYTTYKQAVQFEGVPNNGEFDVDVVNVKGNLLGNPYPSAIDADLFMADSRNSTKINGGLYFWTHNTKRDQDPNNSNKYIYSASDYAVYNLSGPVATSAVSSVGVRNEGDIAAGQSFFVPTNNTTQGKLYFTNSMRISDSGRNSNFFRPSDTKKAVAKEKNRVWLNLTNDGGAFKQLLVGYITGATNGVDRLYDAESMNGNAYIDFYSVNDSKKYTIQGRGVPFDTADEVSLGYQTNIAGTFQIAIDNVDGSLVNQAVYLEDKVTHIIHNLKSGAYSFTTEIGSFNDRFILRYENTSKLGVADVTAKAKKVVVLVKNSQIKINSSDQSISSVMVYDLKGSLIYEKNKIGTNEFSIDHLTSGSQFMIVMTQLEDGKWISEEIIFHD